MVNAFVAAAGAARNGGRPTYVALFNAYWLVLMRVSGPCATTVPPLATTLMDSVLVTVTPSLVSVTAKVKKFDPAAVGLPARVSPLMPKPDGTAPDTKVSTSASNWREVWKTLVKGWPTTAVAAGRFVVKASVPVLQVPAWSVGRPACKPRSTQKLSFRSL